MSLFHLTLLFASCASIDANSNLRREVVKRHGEVPLEDGVPAPGRQCASMPWVGGGIPVDKSLPPLPKYLGLKHIQKVAGTFMSILLVRMTQHLPQYFPKHEGFFRQIDEQIAVQSVARTEQEQNDLFVIGTVRNPCDWYVSLWAFAEQWAAEGLNEIGSESAGEREPFYDLQHPGKLNQTKFANFVEWAHGNMPRRTDSAVGVMSTRYWEGYVSGRDSGCFFVSHPNVCPGNCDGQNLPGAKEGWVDGPENTLAKAAEQKAAEQNARSFRARNADSAETDTGCFPCFDGGVMDKVSRHYAAKPEVEAELDAWQPDGPDSNVDCWVTTENLMDDLKVCLEEYERQAGVKLDWKPFYDKNQFDNKSEHEQCENYYTPELAQTVMDLDRNLFEKFGYDKCCGAPSSHK